MKKLIFGVVCGLLFPVFSFAQSIGDIGISFCNSGIDNQNYFTLITEAGKEDDLCINIKNNSSNSASVHLDFVDGAISDQGNSVCSTPDQQKIEFSKYISNLESDLNLAGGEEIQKNYKLQYPIGFSGLSHGCISYYLNQEGEDGVSLVFRKVNRIDVLVGGVEVTSRIKIKDVFYTGDIYSNRLGFQIENDGNIDQEVTITGIVDGMFKYDELFDLGSFKLPAGESVVVYAENIHIPNYKGLFHINANISNQPNVDFSIAHSNIYNNEFSVAGTAHVKTSFFLWNRWFVAFFVLLLALIIALIIRLKGKKNSH